MNGLPPGIRLLRQRHTRQTAPTEEAVQKTLNLCCQRRPCCIWGDECAELFAQRGITWGWGHIAWDSQANAKAGRYGPSPATWLDYHAHLPAKASWVKAMY